MSAGDPRSHEAARALGREAGRAAIEADNDPDGDALPAIRRLGDEAKRLAREGMPMPEVIAWLHAAEEAFDEILEAADLALAKPRGSA